MSIAENIASIKARMHAAALAAGYRHYCKKDIQ